MLLLEHWHRPTVVHIAMHHWTLETGKAHWCHPTQGSQVLWWVLHAGRRLHLMLVKWRSGRDRMLRSHMLIARLLHDRATWVLLLVWCIAW